MARGQEDPFHLVSPSEVAAVGGQSGFWGSAGFIISSCFTRKLFKVITGFPLQQAPEIFRARDATEKFSEQNLPTCSFMPDPYFLVFPAARDVLAVTSSKGTKFNVQGRDWRDPPIPYI